MSPESSFKPLKLKGLHVFGHGYQNNLMQKETVGPLIGTVGVTSNY